MSKGFYTQCLVILLEKDMTVAELRMRLASYKIAKDIEPAKSWEISGAGLLIEYRKAVNGYVTIDLVPKKWPDNMGDPKKEPILFSAWGTGQFGPYAFPEGLKRAVQQSWTWQECQATVAKHQSFIRIRLSYIFSADKDAHVLPKDCAPQHELRFLTGIAQEILKDSKALCYFNPNGEVALPSRLLDNSMRTHSQDHFPPLDAWCNIRLFRLDDEWCLMDSVGNWQLDIPDVEVGFPASRFTPQAIDAFIRNTSIYLLQHGMIIKNGDTLDGPEKSNWQAKSYKAGICNPPRSVIRCLPVSQEAVPGIFLKGDP